MSGAQQKPSKAACVGFISGMLLLGFAGTLLVLTPSVQQESRAFLEAGARRLMWTDAFNVTHHNSSFDSSAASSVSSGSASSASSLDSSRSIHSSSGSLKSSGAKAEALISSVVAWSGTVGGQLFLMLLFACVYHAKAVEPILADKGTIADKELEYSGKEDFDNGIFGCFSDKWVCIHGFCCPLVRMAHTNAVAGVCGFWETAAAFFCCALISANLGPCCLMIYWRKQIKEVMGIEDHLVNDFICTFFCPYLSLCQQATAVDKEMGYEVTGCCTLKNTLK